MVSSPITLWKMGKQWKHWQILFSWAPKLLQMVPTVMTLKDTCSLKGKLWLNLHSLFKSQDITLPTKAHLVKAMVFSISHVWIWELDYKESWVLKNWCFWTVVLEKTLESPLDCKEIQPVNPKGNQSWIFIGRTDPEAETNTLATWCKELTHWKRLWCWERLRAGGERDDRGWDGWMASPTQWT